MIIHKQDNEVISTCFAGGGELILVASKRASADDVSDYGTVEEYLLSLDPTPHVSKPIVLSNTASFCNDRCMAISNCGLFLLIALYLLFIRFHLVSHFQRKFNQCIILVMVHRTIVITILSSTRILRRMIHRVGCLVESCSNRSTKVKSGWNRPIVRKAGIIECR